MMLKTLIDVLSTLHAEAGDHDVKMAWSPQLRPVDIIGHDEFGTLGLYDIGRLSATQVSTDGTGADPYSAILMLALGAE